MKRVVVKLRIRAGRVGDYLLAHRAVPPELVDLYREAGIRNFSAFVRGRELFLYWECDDPELSRTLVQGRAVEERWQARMKPLMEPTGAPQDLDREGPGDWEEAFHFD